MSAENSIVLERHYTIDEVAALWNVSSVTVLRIFRDKPGVIKLSGPRKLIRKRRPRVHLRIPESVLVKVHLELSR